MQALEGFQRRVLDAIRRFPDAVLPDGAFDELALATYRHQRSNNPLYARFCEYRGAPLRLNGWEDIPALPVSAFKAGKAACFDTAKAVRVFRTSGTTQGEDARGTHYFETLAFYDAAIERLFKHYVLPDAGRMAVASLIPSVEDAPDSSLSYMAGFVRYRFGTPDCFQAIERSRSKFESLIVFLNERAGRGEPVLILSTSLALASFLGFLSEKEVFLQMAPGSRIMDTGGSKGRRSEVSRPELEDLAEKHLKILRAFSVNEYGMTELSSQFYGLSLRHSPPAADQAKETPPWVRVRAIDPDSGKPAGARGQGLLRIWDLANQGSCLCIQTEDEAKISGNSFELLGRREGADLRGCSLTFEEIEDLQA